MEKEQRKKEAVGFLIWITAFLEMRLSCVQGGTGRHLLESGQISEERDNATHPKIMLHCFLNPWLELRASEG